MHVRIVSTVVEAHWLAGVDEARTAGAIAARSVRTVHPHDALCGSDSEKYLVVHLYN